MLLPILTGKNRLLLVVFGYFFGGGGGGGASPSQYPENGRVYDNKKAGLFLWRCNSGPQEKPVGGQGLINTTCHHWDWRESIALVPACVPVKAITLVGAQHIALHPCSRSQWVGPHSIIDGSVDHALWPEREREREGHTTRERWGVYIGLCTHTHMHACSRARTHKERKKERERGREREREGGGERERERDVDRPTEKTETDRQRQS